MNNSELTEPLEESQITGVASVHTTQYKETVCALCACVCVTSIYKVEMLANCSVTMLVHAFVVKVNLTETSEACEDLNLSCRLRLPEQ